VHDSSALLRVEAVEKRMRRGRGHSSSLGGGTDKRAADRLLRWPSMAATSRYQGPIVPI
jgi:hypothetical protein